MSAYGGDDVQEKLYDLEQEEQRIMRELMALNDGADSPGARAGGAAAGKTGAAANAGGGGGSGSPSASRAALNALLAECETDVRAAKGYIRPGVQPIQIVRVVPGAGKPPKSATFLSRPKGTGVDFTVPVTLPEYLQAIKSPIFLNDIRDKCAANKYDSSEDYLEDMRLLARNTATFNRGEDLSWVVQHARLLLEAAEEAVTARREKFFAAESALRKAEAHAAANSTAAPGKRRRSSGVSAKSAPNAATAHKGYPSHAAERAPPGVPPPPANAAPLPNSTSGVTAGARLYVFWQEDRTWYSARVVKKMSVHRAEVEYYDDGSRQIVDLRVDHWRPIDSGGGGGGGTGGGGRARKATLAVEAPPSKRHKSSGSAGAAAAAAQAATAAATARSAAVPAGISRSELTEAVETWTANLEQMRSSLLSEIRSRFDKIERTVIRSDAVRRVLLAVNDLTDLVTDESAKIRTQVASMETRLDESLTAGRARTAPGSGAVATNGVSGWKESPPTAGVVEADVDGARIPRIEDASRAGDSPGSNSNQKGPYRAEREPKVDASEVGSDSSKRDEAIEASGNKPTLEDEDPLEDMDVQKMDVVKEPPTTEKEDANMEGLPGGTGVETSRSVSPDNSKSRDRRDSDGRVTDGAAESTVVDAHDGIGDSVADGRDESTGTREEMPAKELENDSKPDPKPTRPAGDFSAVGSNVAEIQGVPTDAPTKPSPASSSKPQKVESTQAPGNSDSRVENDDEQRDGVRGEDSEHDQAEKTTKLPEKSDGDSSAKPSDTEKGPDSSEDDKDLAGGDVSGSPVKDTEDSEKVRLEGKAENVLTGKSSVKDDSSSSDGDSSSSSEDEDDESKKSDKAESEADSSDDDSSVEKSVPPTHVVEASGEHVSLAAKTSDSKLDEERIPRIVAEKPRAEEKQVD